MRVKANISFAGVISMAAGEERECTEGSTLSDLLAAGLVAPVQPEEPAKQKRLTHRKEVVMKNENKGAD